MNNAQYQTTAIYGRGFNHDGGGFAEILIGRKAYTADQVISALRCGSTVNALSDIAALLACEAITPFEAARRLRHVVDFIRRDDQHGQ